MILNNTIPGLPEWPYISTEDGREYTVQGRHVTYEGYIRGRWTWVLLAVAGGCLTWKLAPFIVNQPGDYAFLFGGYCILFVISAVMHFPRYLADWWFGAESPVRFAANGCFVNGFFFDGSTGVPTQFKANRPYLTEQQHRALMQRCQGKPGVFQGYEMEFMRVEMIYGARLIYITSVEDAYKAAQFVVALQRAQELASAVKGSDPSLHFEASAE